MDHLAQTVIDPLVEQGKALFEERKEDGSKRYTVGEIHAILATEKEKKLAEGTFINSLLEDEGIASVISPSVHFMADIQPQFSIRTKTQPWAVSIWSSSAM